MAEVTAALKPLIARLRREVGDEPEALLTDGELADALEEFQCVVRYRPLRPLETRLPTGSVRYLEFESGLEWWATDVAIVDGSWESVEASSFDWKNGRAVFATHQSSALYISGTHYDFWRAVEQVIDQIIAKLRRTAIDQRDKDAELKRNQQISTLRDMKRAAQAKQTPGHGQMARLDA